MVGRHSITELGFLRLDTRSKVPLFRQLYDSIRTAILDGLLAPNCRIPSSRDLVNQLGVSRTTVVTATELLIAEGYLRTISGSGTFVSSDMPDERPFINSTSIQSEAGTTGTPRQKSDMSWYTGIPKPFCPGLPALDEFPSAIWSKLVRRVWNRIPNDDLSYGEPAGYYPLRQSIAEHLRVHRGVRCETSQVMIVSGTQQAIDIVSRISLNDGDKVLFENPGYVNGRNAFAQHGAQIAPIMVNEQGAMIGKAIEECPDARMVYVTPSHQYPIGTTLPIEHRLELIHWAGRCNGLIVEDDYDSEYRCSQKPIPAMQGLDSSNRTIYVGSFSKVVFPALGMGYAIVPPQWVKVFESTLRLTSRPVSQVDQIVLHEFIREGHFGRHLRRMRKTYSIRRQTFAEEVHKHLAGSLTIIGSQAGLHCATILRADRRDTEVAEQLDELGIIARPLSHYYQVGTPKAKRLNGLVFGFACASPARIRIGIKKVANVIGPPKTTPRVGFVTPFSRSWR